MPPACILLLVFLRIDTAVFIRQQGSLRGQRLVPADLDARIGSMLNVFRLLRDKDMFLEEYRTLMARRLLEQKSASVEAEERIIGYIKLQCGAQFTARLDGMVKDLSIAKQHIVDFINVRACSRCALCPLTNPLQTTRGVEFGGSFSATVLTQGFWPRYRQINVILPRPMSLMAEVREFPSFDLI